MSALAEALAKRSGEEAQRMAVDVVMNVVRGVLGIEKEDIDVDRPLTDAGMDSLLAVELRNALQREVGKTLPATIGYDYPTVRAIAIHLTSLAGMEAKKGEEEEEAEG